MSTTPLKTPIGAGPAADPVIARDEAGVEALREVWERLGTTYVDADLDYFLASVRHRPEVVRPHVVLVGGQTARPLLVIGWIESAAFPCAIGYTTVYRPTLRCLRIAHGGISGNVDADGADEIFRICERALDSGEADVAVIPAIRDDSQLGAAFSRQRATVRRQLLRPPSMHRRMVLPASLDELLAARDRRSRYNLRRQISLFERKFAANATIARLEDEADYETIFELLEPLAASTYQRRLDAGFSDTPERRAHVRLGLERGWFRAWVLVIDGIPVAFWQGNVRDRTLFVSSTGYDPAYSDDGVGTYLQLKMFEDACADPGVDVLDFGWGDAPYKSRFGNEGWSERDVVLFARSFRGWKVGIARSAIRGVDGVARRVLARTGLTARVRRAWRRRLRQARPQSA